MSEDSGNVNHIDPAVQPFVDFWSSYAKQADDAAREFVDGLNGAQKIKSWHQQWLEAVSKSLDAYMRSPAFLQAMKHNTEFAIKAKRQAHDLTAEIARNVNIPTATDISGLFGRLHSIEEVILSKLDRIEGRLTAVERQMGISQTTDA